MNIYFLGGGNMARAIIAGLRTQSSDNNIFVANRSANKNQQLQQDFHVATDFKLPENISASDVLILAVKPQDMKAALQDVSVNGALVISLAAGLEVDTLSNWVGSRRIVRAMPNMPSAIGLGVTGLFAAEEVSEHDCDVAERILAACGMIHWLHDENQMHAITAISGSGTGYVFYLLNALCVAAQNLGFDEEMARSLALNTFRGAVAVAAQSNENFDFLQQKVTSKGGTTLAALNAFKAAGVATGVAAGTQAAFDRSIELSEMLKD